jgi:hypothetical protein
MITRFLTFVKQEKGFFSKKIGRGNGGEKWEWGVGIGD